MADYKTIHGTKVRSYTTDPDNLITGEVWYDKTNNVLQFQAAGAGSWATGRSMNTGRRSMGGAGISNSSALGFGGNSNPGSPPYHVDRDHTESYNGTTWTEVADLNTARGVGGGDGTQTSALYFGGTPNPAKTETESWNGTCWSEVADLNTGRSSLAAAGADNTSALAFGGLGTPPNAPTYDLTESWNGTSWAEVNDLNLARTQLMGFGIKTSAIANGGESAPAYVKKTESWNGSSWTEVADSSFERAGGGRSGTDNTSGLIFGGFDASPTDLRTNKVELWNGTAWTEQADLTGTQYTSMSGAGTSSSAISFGGEGPSNQMRTATEEWSNPTLTIKTVSTD